MLNKLFITSVSVQNIVIGKFEDENNDSNADETDDEKSDDENCISLRNINTRNKKKLIEEI